MDDALANEILPGKNGSEVCNDPLGWVWPEDGNGVMSLEAEVDETSGGKLDLGEVVLVGPRLAHPVTFDSERHNLKMKKKERWNFFKKIFFGVPHLTTYIFILVFAK